jgi:hypothetical protein
MPRTRKQEEYEVVRRIDQASPSALFSTQAWAWASVFYGVAITVGGPERWTGTAFAALRQVPGAPALFGCLFIIGGGVTYIGCRTGQWRTRNAGMWLLMILYLGFAGCFAFAAINDPRSSLGGVVIYAVISLQLMVLRRLRGKSPAHDAKDR